jgi:hypothetical protein
MLTGFGCERGLQIRRQWKLDFLSLEKGADQKVQERHFITVEALLVPR